MPIIVFKDCFTLDGYAATEFAPAGDGRKSTFICCLHLQEQRWSNLKPTKVGEARVYEMYKRKLPTLLDNATTFTV